MSDQTSIIKEMQDVIAAQNEAITALTAKVEALEVAKPAAPTSVTVEAPKVVAREVAIGKDTYLVVRPKFSVQGDKGVLTPIDLQAATDKELVEYFKTYPSAFQKK
jgi:hypothetical protein